MELALAIISLVLISIVYVHYRYNKSLYETQEREDGGTYLTKENK